MRILNVLGIKHLSNLSIPNSEKIEEILNEIITPEFQRIGLKKLDNKYVWENSYNENGIKSIIRFTYRGLTANFMIGSNFKFIPEYNNNNKLVYRKDWPHLFENINFFNKKKTLSLWNEYYFRNSLNKMLKSEFQKISNFIKEQSLIENNIILAEKQLKSEDFEYKIHSPNPKYLLSFLIAKKGNKDKALKLMTEYLELKPEMNKEVLKLIEK